MCGGQVPLPTIRKKRGLPGSDGSQPRSFVATGEQVGQGGSFQPWLFPFSACALRWIPNLFEPVSPVQNGSNPLPAAL